MNDETRYLGPTGSGGEPPRQYFPGEHDPNYRYQEPQPQQYQQYQQQPTYQPEPPRASRSGGALPMLLGILFGLTLIAAAVFFLLWRNAEAELAEPVPPVTVTQTTSVTVTETTTQEPEPAPLPEVPTEVPTELPSDLPEIDVEGWLNDLLGSR